MSPLRVNLLGLGLCGPGFADWPSSRDALRDAAAWAPAPTAIAAPSRLPPAERRRAGAIVKLALGVADAAVAQAGVDPVTLATVFTAASGDGANLHAMCEVLATPERLVSPTRFTNSVHNAAAGYWHIAVASRAASTSVAMHDGGFAAGLLEAAAQVLATGEPVLLVAADTPYPEPLNSVRPLPDSMGVAMVLAPASHEGGALAALSLTLDAGDFERDADARLEALRSGIPAARALPLLHALARGGSATCAIEYLDGLPLRVDIEAPAA